MSESGGENTRDYNDKLTFQKSVFCNSHSFNLFIIGSHETYLSFSTCVDIKLYVL